ncbi:MAG TPA: hypothetical protein VGR67_05730 [Candidatus Polarisedimenticolia bacterium]|nr:hypothetical protein [Candidatus Polarisedimenticolia bacterium]
MGRTRATGSLLGLARIAGVAMTAAFLFLPPAFGGDKPRVGVLGDVKVEKGEVVPDDVICLRGTATIEGKVEGNVIVIDGKLNLSGEAKDVIAVLSESTISPGASVHGDLVQILGTLQKPADFTVGGQRIDIGSHLPPRIQHLVSRGLLGILILLRLISIITSLVIVFLLALLVPDRIERMSLSVQPRWPASLGFGLLASVLVGMLFAIFFVTIIGIPLAFLLYLVAKVLCLMGVAAILVPLGRRVGLGTGLIGPEASVLATVMVGFFLVALVRFVPVLGELVWLVLSVIGFGLALVTKVGSTTPAPAESLP